MNLLSPLANLPALAALAVIGAALLVWAVVRSTRGARRAVVPGLAGLALVGLAALTALTHPFALARDIEHPERLAGVELSAPPPQSNDWPQWRGPNRDGVGRCPGLRTDWTAHPPEVLWKTPCGGGYSSLAIVGGRVFTQDFRSGRESVLCLDAATGERRWAYDYPADYSGLRAGYGSGPRATPTVHDGRVYAVGATGKFTCLEADPAGGKPHLHWEQDLLAEFDSAMPQWGVACSPLVEGERVIVQPGGKSGSVAAFDRKSGAKVWSALDDPSGYSSPVAATLAGVRQIVAFTGTRLVGLRPADGELLWSYDWPTQFNANIATPIIAGDTVFISSGYNAGCALLRISDEGGGLKAEPAWVRPRKLMRNHHSSSLLRDGFIYGFDADREWKCVDLRTATERWSSPRPGKGSAILADGHLIALSQDGTLSLIEATPDEFRLKGKLPDLLTGSDCWSLPALSRSRLYLRDGEKVVCLKVADE